MKRIIVAILVVTMLIALTGCEKVKELTSNIEAIDEVKKTVEDLSSELSDEVDSIKDAVENQTEDIISDVGSQDDFGSRDAIVLDKKLKDRALLESVQYQTNPVAMRGYEITATNFYSYEGAVTESTTIIFDEQGFYRYTDEAGTSFFTLWLTDGTGYFWDDVSKKGTIYPAEINTEADDYNGYDMDMEFSQYYDSVTEAYVTNYNGFECLFMVVDDNGSETHFWTDLKTGMDIKSEYYYNGNLESSYEVLELKVLEREPRDVFTPPSDVVFEEFSWDYDMDNNMDGYEMDDIDLEPLLQMLEDAGIEVTPDMTLDEILSLIEGIEY